MNFKVQLVKLGTANPELRPHIRKILAALTASPTKLRNGDWGVTVKSERVRPGDSVTVTTKSGKSWEALIEKVIWKGNGVAICSVRKSSKSRTPSPSYRSRGWGGGRCRGCGGAVKDAPHHRAMEGYCGSCAFDEFDN
jgi:hypothetical protein